VRAHERIVGGAQLIVRRFGVVGAVAYVPYGPVFATDAPPGATTLLANTLRCHCTTTAIRALFVQPPEGGEGAAAALTAIGFRPSRVKVAPGASMRIELQRDPVEILGGMRAHTRKDVRHSWVEPVRVRCGTRDDLDSFYDLYCCTAERQQFTPLPRSHFDSLWDHLHPTGQMHVLLADVDGTDVAANIASSFGDVVTGRFLGFDPKRLPKRLRPAEALVWTHIAWARDRGFSVLDVGGVDRDEAIKLACAANADANISADAVQRFRFGGVPVVYPDPLELIPNPVVRAAVHARDSDRFPRLKTAIERHARAGRTTSS
jgi:hypothetical protein